MQRNLRIAECPDAVAVGYQNHWDPGSGPLYCAISEDTFYRADVGFDIGQLTQFGQAHGLKTATMPYGTDNDDTPKAACLATIQAGSEDWGSWAKTPDVLPGGEGALVTPLPETDGFPSAFRVDIHTRLWGNRDRVGVVLELTRNRNNDYEFAPAAIEVVV